MEASASVSPRGPEQMFMIDPGKFPAGVIRLKNFRQRGTKKLTALEGRQDLRIGYASTPGTWFWEGS